jgi:hypothetical protein
MIVKERKSPHSRVLVYQAVGFLSIIALSWFVELTGLRKWVLGNHPYISDFRESTLEMLLVLGVWFIVTSSTRRVLNHMRHLQGFMRVCSWCHHIDYQGNWVAMEEFLERGFDAPTTHGICPACLARQKAAIDQARRATANPSTDRKSPAPKLQPGSGPALESAQANP